MATVERHHMSIGQIISQVWRYGLAIFMALVFVFPFLIMLTTAFKPSGEIFSAPPEFWPRSWTLEHFGTAMTQFPFWRYLSNTLLISVLSVVGTLLASPLVAYSLAKLRWPGRNLVFITVLATMMLPPQVTLIPIYMMWNGLGATNTYIPLIVPAFLGTPFFIFLIRQFLMSIPNELIEAAKMDGASEWRVYWDIVLPIARPALVTSAVFQFVWTWTDFLNPLIYINDDKAYTLSIGLYSFLGSHGVQWGPLMAACVLFTLPAIVIFILGQRYFIGGVAAGALK
ncbi:sugar ABC transporter permease [Devosia epidermidihirudinis]|uniref:Sugar ABC transporter permease n=1 Tax=Devosia epidermidihirudinis TaxID=1293439 RepID=A0A0F5QBE5_9HYPH|nr:carbohydrate ABC transporter permease [Devosia epidermidihirudinis]KKC38033.1 sugar ABC transporter permease [Devosia epidermidihirudinis]